MQPLLTTKRLLPARYAAMIPFMFVAAARRQGNTNDIHSAHSSQRSFHSSYSSHGASNNATSHNQAGGMPLGDLEAGHGQVTNPHYTPPPSYTGTSLPSTPPPSYHGVPLPYAPAPNTPRPYVNNHQIPRRSVPRPPARRSRRRRCCSDPCSPRHDKCCAIIICILACAFIMVVFPLVVIKTGKDGHKGEEAQIHCRSAAVVVVAATAAHGGCG